MKTIFQENFGYFFRILINCFRIFACLICGIVRAANVGVVTYFSHHTVPPYDWDWDALLIRVIKLLQILHWRNKFRQLHSRCGQPCTHAVGGPPPSPSFCALLWIVDKFIIGSRYSFSFHLPFCISLFPSFSLFHS